MSTTFQINPYLELKLEKGRTNIYVDGILFDYCKYLFLSIPTEEVDLYSDIESIDEVAQYLDNSLEPFVEKMINTKLPSHVEFWGHCSNLQAWYENNYNTNLIHNNLGFPLLKELTNAGDPQTKKVFKEEISTRLQSRYMPVIIYLLEEGYLEYLTYDEIASIGFDRIDTFFTLAQEYYENGFLEGVNLESMLSYVKTLTPRTAGEWSKKANLYKILEMPEEMYDCYRRGVKQFPNDLTLLTKLLPLEHERKNNKNVMNIARKLIRLDPEEPIFWVSLGLSYKDHSNYSKAIDCLQKALVLDPDNVDHLVYLINIHEITDGIEVSMSVVKDALEKFHDNIEACKKIADECYDGANAELAYKRVLYLNPYDIDSWMRLAKINRDIEKYLHARRYAKKYIEICEKCAYDELLPDAYSLLGKIYVNNSCLRRGLECYKLASAFDPENADAWEGQANIFNLLGEKRGEEVCRKKVEAIKRAEEPPDTLTLEKVGKKLFGRFSEEEFDEFFGELDRDAERERMLEFFKDIREDDEYILHIHGKQGDDLAMLLGLYSHDAKMAFSSWAEDLKGYAKWINNLLDMFEEKELTVTHAEGNIIALEGYKEALENAVRQKMLLKKDFLLELNNSEEERTINFKEDDEFANSYGVDK